jgi:hypothetical protein
MSIDEIQDLNVGDKIKFADLNITWQVDAKRASGLVLANIPTGLEARRKNFKTWNELTAVEPSKV